MVDMVHPVVGTVASLVVGEAMEGTVVVGTEDQAVVVTEVTQAVGIVDPVVGTAPGLSAATLEVVEAMEDTVVEDMEG